MSEPIYYQACPDCGGHGYLSRPDHAGRETQHECERCRHWNGMVPVEQGRLIDREAIDENFLATAFMDPKVTNATGVQLSWNQARAMARIAVAALGVGEDDDADA